MSNFIPRNLQRPILALSVLTLFGATAFAQHINLATTPSSPKSVVGVLSDYSLFNGGNAFIIDGDLYLNKNFLNDGDHNFTTGTALSFMNFVGSSQQIVQGTGFTNVFDLKIDNPTAADAIELDQNITINGEADFTDGIVGADDAINGLMIFTQNGSAVNMSDQSYVDGRVQKIGSTTFDFPIGDSNGTLFKYRRASIGAPTDAADAFTARYFLEDSNAMYDHGSRDFDVTLIDNAEYWVISHDVGTSKPTITLTLDDDTTPANILATPNAITIVRWNGTLWVNEGGVYNPSTKEIATTPSDYGVFTLGHKLETEPQADVYNVITLKEDGLNDSWVIPILDLYSDNEVQLFNRWGVLVYEQEDYVNNSAKAFMGYSDGRVTLAREERLPTGTYYYSIKYVDSNNVSQEIGGWLFIFNNTNN